MKCCKPTFESIATFKKDTKGLWTGKFRDIFGGRAIVRIRIEF
ncbi:Uncharacterised protein [Streptococcus pneumoniae]|nr:Uncharacterised protein [Streptococcus pneumoniae]VMS12028.1 Uncharacterised protein [Streptococcus pneumoniae]VOP19837.1 Uncharacterised protein [Streptococcus pneumoniae]VOP26728.1 Uncharacterised protein [Streptococcus pneumoniae]VQS72208.1 Uncharacterised protein [Streptococcus pneumoniae]